MEIKKEELEQTQKYCPKCGKKGLMQDECPKEGLPNYYCLICKIGWFINNMNEGEE